MSRQKKTMIRIVTATVALTGAALGCHFLQLPRFLELFLYLLIYGWIGYDIVLEAIGGLGRRISGSCCGYAAVPNR